jgi:hypothetical protein
MANGSRKETDSESVYQLCPLHRLDERQPQEVRALRNKAENDRNALDQKQASRAQAEISSNTACEGATRQQC